MTESTTRAQTIATWLTIVSVVVLCLPALVFTYLPMTDLPQHTAIASILKNYGDPAYGFEAYYDVDWWRVPYVLPYALAVALSYVMPLHVAMQIVVFLALIAYPLAVMMLLRAARKPLWFALLAIPLVYNRPFFWGFVNYTLGIGLAIAAFAIFVEPRKSWRRDCVFAVLTVATIFCHIYALALLCALIAAYAVVGGGYRELRARPWLVAPLAVGVALWLWKSGASHGYGQNISPPLSLRLKELPRQIFGGYQDSSESVVLLLFVAAWLALAWPTLPVTRAKLRALQPLERVAYVAFIGNLVAYFVMPQSTWTAKFIHFRHASLALLLLPLLATTASIARATLLVRALPVIAAVSALANSWVHLALFAREARTFTAIVDVLPRAPKLVSIVFDRNGKVMATTPYLHFTAYAQAEKGGIISMTFPDFFWNLPVTTKPDWSVPDMPWGFEWKPQSYDEKKFGYFYEWALVRLPGKLIPVTTEQFPYAVVAQSPPWYLYKRVPPPTPSSP